MSVGRLPEEQAWNGEHASEAARVMMADAQTALVPDAVLAHVETCAECNEAIAEAALLSIRTGDELSEVAAAGLLPEATRGVSEPGASVARLPVPWRALLVAAALALVGALPSLLVAPAAIGTTAVSVLRSAPHIAKSVAHLVDAGSGSPWVTLAPAVLLLLVGFALTRALPTPVSRRVER